MSAEITHRLDQTFQSGSSEVRWGVVGDGPPLILCHGTPWSSFVWRHTIRELASKRRIYYWDMPGFGVSSRSHDVSIAKNGAVLAALIGHWNLDRPAIIGHDIGGAVALHAHLVHGIEISRLALVDAVVLRPWGSPFFRLVAKHHEVFESLPANLHRALVTEYIQGASSAGIPTAVADQLVAPWCTTEGQRAFYTQIAQTNEHDTERLEPLLGTISAPTLIVWGADDAWLPVEHAARLHATIPGSQLIIIDDAGHLLLEDAPAALNSHLTEFLNQPSGPSHS